MESELKSVLGHMATPRAFYPPVADVLSTDLSGHDLKYYRDSFPQAKASQVEAIREYLHALDTRAKRYEHVRVRGEAAISRYDIEVAASGSVDLAVNTATALTYNHIIYTRLCLLAAFQLAPSLVAYIEAETSEQLIPAMLLAPVDDMSQLTLF